MSHRDFAPDPEQPRPAAFLDSPDEPLDALAGFRRRMDAARAEGARRDAEDRGAAERLVRSLLLALAALFLVLALCGLDRQSRAALAAAQEAAR